MGKYRESLKNKNFLFLWLAQIVSQFGDRITQMALIGLVAGRSPGSAMELAKILSFTIIPVFIVGPIAGVYVDRWDRRTTLFICDFLRAVLVLSIPLLFMSRGSMVPIYMVVFLSFCLSRFYVPAKMSIVPDIVDSKDLLPANSLVTMTGMIAFVLGCALGGFIVEKIGPGGGFVCDAFTFLTSGLLIASVSRDLKFKMDKAKIINVGKEMISDIQKSVVTELKEGISYLVNHRDIRFIINMLFILFSAAGAIYVVIIVFIQEAFGSITRDLGILAVFLGIGLFLGAFLYGKWGERFQKFKTIFFCLIFGGLMLVLFASLVQRIQSLFLASLLAVLLGMIAGPIFIAANTVVHQVSDQNMRGKVFSSLEVVIHFAFLVSMFISSYLAEHVSRHWILIGIGVIFSIVGLVGFMKKENLTLLKERA